MSVGPRRPIGLQVLNRAFSRFAHVVGYCCVLASLVDVVGYQGGSPTALLWPLVFPLLATLVILAALDRWRTTGWAILFLVVGAGTVYVLALSLLLQVEGLRSDTLAISLVRVALILVGGSGFTWRAAVLWTLAGYLIGEAADWTAALQVGLPLSPDEGAMEALAAVLLLLGTLVVSRGAQPRMRPELDRAAIDDEVFELRQRIEGRAAALLHDTVLEHLDAVRMSRGTLDAELRQQLLRDLELLHGDEWLGDPDSQQEPSDSEWGPSTILSAVTEAREKSLTVDVSGDLTVIERLTPRQDIAVGLAVKQCLVNVLRHAQVEHADVVMLGSNSGVSVMVIDAGRGFSEKRIGVDRLGIRQSIRRRVESVGGSVRLWSTPGRGTFIMITVPAPRSVQADAGAVHE